MNIQLSIEKGFLLYTIQSNSQNIFCRADSGTSFLGFEIFISKLTDNASIVSEALSRGFSVESLPAH